MPLVSWIQKNWPVFAIYNIYAVGIIGFLIPDLRELFASMTWVSLLISFFLLVFCHEKKALSLWISVLVIALSGYFIEVLGVHTGMVFGEYTYGSSLGLKVLDVPLMIGVNWVLVVYLTNYISKQFFDSSLFIVLVGALLMTGLDLLIEPFAIQFDLWSWTSGHIPMQNYVMWFIIGLGMQYFFLKYNLKLNNPVAIPLAVSMGLFFIIIDLFVI